MKDWQAAIAAYTILFILAETDAAPLAAAIAWTATIGAVFYWASKGELHMSALVPASRTAQLQGVGISTASSTGPVPSVRTVTGGTAPAFGPGALNPNLPAGLIP